jgi:hypothetical protein
MICSGQIGRDRRREVFVGGAAAADLGTHLRAMLSLRDHGRPQRVDEICGCILRWPVLRDRSELGGRACPIDPHRRGRHDARRRGAVFLVELAITATSCSPRLNENSGMMSGTRIAGAAGRPSPASGFLAILAADRAHGSCRARSSEYGDRTRSASCACRRSRAPLAAASPPPAPRSRRSADGDPGGPEHSCDEAAERDPARHGATHSHPTVKKFLTRSWPLAADGAATGAKPGNASTPAPPPEMTVFITPFRGGNRHEAHRRTRRL